VAAAIAVACVPEPRELASPVWPAAADAREGVVPTAPRRPVLVLGDSITDSAYGPITGSLLDRGWDPTISAHSGDMVRDRLAQAGERAAERPEAVIINLGTNDSACVLTALYGPKPCRVPGFSFDVMRSDADALLGVFVPGTCIIGVRPTMGDEIGDHWRRRMAEGVVRSVVSWRAETDAHPGYLQDQLGHLTRTGRDAYGTFVARAVDDACRSGTGNRLPGPRDG
jgi:hypothetical protein